MNFFGVIVNQYVNGHISREKLLTLAQSYDPALVQAVLRGTYGRENDRMV